jgi:hypothetical protein
MARPARQSSAARLALPLCVLTLALASLLPARLLMWTGWFGSLATLIVAPIADPAARAGRLLTPDGSTTPTATLETLQRELDAERLLRQQAELEASRLRALAEQLARGAAVDPGVPVRQIARPVISPGRGLLTVRGGEDTGVTRSTVATTAGVQLVGRVQRVDARTCIVQTITDEKAGPITAAVFLDDQQTRSRACLLRPRGDGTLAGDAEAAPPEATEADALRPGQVVRLQDDQWPRAAQMLVIGRVERVEPHPREPQREVVVVRPELDLRRVSEVILRVPTVQTEATP